ncbi:MAG: cytochrome c biogenesis CcdA family protein [Spirochaetales bacterium]
MENINIAIALAAGLLSFLSPCVLPLVPSYVSYVTGVSLDTLADYDHSHRKAIVARTVMFVLGFSLVFVALGIVFSGSAVLVGGLASWVNTLAGSIVIILGLNVIFDFASFLNRERRVHLHNKPKGYFGSAAVGMAFGAGWTPCIGPVLSGILLMAGTGNGMAEAAVLLFAYSLGLGSPFIVASIFFSPTVRYLKRITPWMGTIKLATGLLLTGVGVLVATGQLQNLQATLYRAAGAIEQWAERYPDVAYWGPGLIALIAAAAPFIRAGNRRSLWRVGPALVLGLFAGLHFANILPLTHALALWFTYEGI